MSTFESIIEFETQLNPNDTPNLVSSDEEPDDLETNNYKMIPQNEEEFLKIIKKNFHIKKFENEKDEELSEKIPDDNSNSINSQDLKNITKNKIPINSDKSDIKLFNPSNNLKDLLSHYKQPCFFGLGTKDIINQKRKRGNMHDNVSKKIKVNLGKNIIMNLNKRIKAKKMNKYFHRFDQSQITDVTIKKNEQFLTKTLKEMICEKPKFKNKDKLKKNEDKWNSNIQLLEELEKSDDSFFKKILGKTMEELYNEYLDSKEFIESIKALKNEFYYDYIQNYIQVAKNFVNFYKYHS